MKLPRPLFFAVVTVLMAVVPALRIGIPAYRQSVALQKLRPYGQVADVRRVGPEWLRRLVGEERMLPFDEVRWPQSAAISRPENRR